MKINIHVYNELEFRSAYRYGHLHLHVIKYLINLGSYMHKYNNIILL